MPVSVFKIIENHHLVSWA